MGGFMKGLTLLITCAFCSISVNGANIHVPAVQPTIQEEVDAADPLDSAFAADITFAGEGEIHLGTTGQSFQKKPPYNGPQNTPNLSKQGGDTFDDAIQIAAIPDTLFGTTEGYNDDYDEVCPHSGSTSPDVVYYFDCFFDTTVKISLCNAGTDYDTKIYIYEDSYTPGNPYACNDDACPGYVSEIFGLDLFGGHTYYIVIDGYGGDFGNYELTIDGFYPCDSFPAGWGDCIDENEPCGDDNNSGCGGFPPAWEPINCGDTICGTIWAEGGTRDTDWYSFTLTETKLVTFTAEGEFPMVIGFIDTADCNLFTGLDPYALSPYPCSLLTTSRIAGPGVYWLHLSTSNFYDYPCGTTNDYYMTVTCEDVNSVWYVKPDGSGDAPTIQAAIDSASTSDTVLLAAGTYTGNGNRDLNFNGKNIVLISESGPEVTIIDCQGDTLDEHYGVLLENGEDTTAVIEGITITNGYLTVWKSGAIWMKDASATVRNCIITGNYGNGIAHDFALNSTFRLYNSTITYNSADGVWSEAWTTLVSGCEISFNGYFGMNWASWNKLELSDCLFEGNSEAGLMIWTDGPDFHVSNCTFVGNGTGLQYDWNFPKSGDEAAKSLRATSLIENCLFAFNTNYGLYSSMFPYDVNVYCNDAFGNGTAGYIMNDPPTDSSNNYEFDPLFCDTSAGNYYIFDNSPCAPANNSCDILIGALEVGCTCCQNRGNTDGEGGISVTDLTYLVDYLFFNGDAPPCPEEGNVDAEGAINVADVTYLVDYLFFEGSEPPPCP
jgi:hypothetical protein